MLFSIFQLGLLDLNAAMEKGRGDKVLARPEIGTYFFPFNASAVFLGTEETRDGRERTAPVSFLFRVFAMHTQRVWMQPCACSYQMII